MPRLRETRYIAHSQESAELFPRSHHEPTVS
jgi:hypothetical protein